MKEVDQESGQDLVPARRIATGANMERSGGAPNGRYGGLNDSAPVIEDDLHGKPNRSRKRMTSPERWEIKQLIASGAISAHDYPDINEDFNAAMNGEGNFEEEEDIDIE
ncbi:MAG: DEAH-box ATP-dependent RNA helicase prp22, partial [Watsoniomyces obsoletus]